MIYHNNAYLPKAEFTVSSNNRAFKYGDGLFESCLVINGKAPLLNYNLTRLKKGMQLLGIHVLDEWDLNYFEKIIANISEKSILTNARCKITVWRAGDGLYLPESNEPELLIELHELKNPPFTTVDEKCKLGLFEAVPRQIHPLSALKTNNAIPYILAANFASKNKFDDVLLLNTEGCIADAISSNVFIVKNNTYYTTVLNNGGIHGTMQSFICDNAANLNIEVGRINMTVSEVLSADEVLLTNAIQGVKLISAFQDSYYVNKLGSKLLGDLNAYILSL